MSLVAGVPGNLTCRSRGDAQPAPELLWFRDGIRLDGATFHQVGSQSLCHSLFIQRDSGSTLISGSSRGNGSHSGLNYDSGQEPGILVQPVANYLLLYMAFNLSVPCFLYVYRGKNSRVTL